MIIYLSMIESPEEKTKFETIYYEYRDLMFYAANKILLDTYDAEDAVHEAFLKIVDIIDKIDTVDCPQTRALVVIITERKAIDLYRKRRKQNIVPFETEYIGGQSCADIERIEDGQDIAQAIAKLPEKYRTVLLLKYSHGYSIEETAQILSISKENVKKTLHRGKKSLEQLLVKKEVRQ